jgi:hypothetical protein
MLLVIKSAYVTIVIETIGNPHRPQIGHMPHF